MGDADVLLVEDDTDTRESLALLIETALGMKVDTARDGLEGRQRLSGPNAYRLVLTDERMPKMGGSELLRWARRHRPEVHRALMSAYHDGPELAHSAGGEIFLRKPLDLDAALEALRTLAEAPPAA